MNKYERKNLINEKIPGKINDALLSIILYKIKKQIDKAYDFIDFK